MKGKDLGVPVLSYDDLREAARVFLNKHHDGSTPVPIEKIIDPHMGINITCQASLQYLCNVDAFVNAKCDTIYVDAVVYLSPNPNRYRFSLAHELAHILLHKEVIAKLQFDTIGEWKQCHANMRPEDHAWLEWQAHSLGGLLLVPPEALGLRFRAVVSEAKEEGFKSIQPLVEQRLADHFIVSVDVIQRRLTKDGLNVQDPE